MVIMSLESPEMHPGLKVLHPELGEGVVVGREPTGYVTVFFRAIGERRVPAYSREDLIEYARQDNPNSLAHLKAIRYRGGISIE